MDKRILVYKECKKEYAEFGDSKFVNVDSAFGMDRVTFWCDECGEGHLSVMILSEEMIREAEMKARPYRLNRRQADARKRRA